MRYFPSAARQRLVGLLTLLSLLALVVGLLGAPSAGAAQDDEHKLKHKQEKVQDKIEDRKDHLDEASREYSSASRRLVGAQSRLDTARSRVRLVTGRLVTARSEERRLQRELVAARGRLETATERLAEGRRETERQKADLREAVTGAYGEGDAQLRAFGSLLDAQSLDDLTMQLTAQDVVIGSSEEAYQDLQAAERRLERQRREVREAAQEVAGKEREARAQAGRTLVIFRQVRTWRNKTAALVRGLGQARTAAYRAKKRDQQILRELRQRESRITARLRELAKRQSGQRGYRGGSGGFLSSPAPGAYITSPYGWRKHPIYGYWGLHNGTDFGTGCGMKLRAGATGTVVSRYYDSVYGNRVYLNVGNVNGKSMTLVYNHLSSYAVSVGDRVERGGAIGRSGTTGWSTGCHLHFTVLMNGNPVDPMKFL